MPTFRLLSAAFLLATIACQAPAPAPAPPPDVAALTQAIQEREKEWSAAFLKADANAIASLYTEDGKSLQATGKHDVGRTAIAAGLQSQFDSITFVAREDITDEVIPVGEQYLFEVGHYTSRGTPKAGGPERTRTGSYVVLWRKDADGVWRLHRDIGSDAPLPKP